ITVGPPPYAGGKAHDRPACRGMGRSTPVRREKRRASPCRVYDIPVHPRTPGERGETVFGTPIDTGHPRTPGEKNYVVETWGTYCGPPPYAGGKSRDPACPLGLRRSTPARRGKTAPGSVAPMQIAVHPRTPGENNDEHTRGSQIRGPPPHAGGKR